MKLFCPVCGLSSEWESFEEGCLICKFNNEEEVHDEEI